MGNARVLLPPRPYNWRATVGRIVGIVVVAGAMGVFMRVIPTPFTSPRPPPRRRCDDRTTINGEWEKSSDGRTWSHDFALTYRRIG